MKRKQLKVHVLNAGKGDSILIEFPNNIWGIVDSNRKYKDAPIPALLFLKKMEKLDRGVTVAVISADGLVNPRKETVGAILSSGAKVFCTNKPRRKDFPVKLKPQTLSAFKFRNVYPISTPVTGREEPMESYVTATIDAYGNVTTRPEDVYEFVDIDTIRQVKL